MSAEHTGGDSTATEMGPSLPPPQVDYDQVGLEPGVADHIRRILSIPASGILNSQTRAALRQLGLTVEVRVRSTSSVDRHPAESFEIHQVAEYCDCDPADVMTAMGRYGWLSEEGWAKATYDGLVDGSQGDYARGCPIRLTRRGREAISYGV